MPLPVPFLARAVVAAGQVGSPGAFPGPGPWDAKAWAGAALYVLLFLAALGGILVLLDPPPESPR